MRHATAIRGVILLGVLAGATPAGKLAAAQPAKEVKVSVVAILASDASKEIDPRLATVAREIRKVRTHAHLTGFRVAKMTCKNVPVGAAEHFALVADQEATVTVLKAGDKAGSVQLKISPPTLGDITYTVSCEGFFPIVTKYQTRNREVLIIAVRVQHCKK